jgi:PPOX class probable F420-dependent enzyme
MEINEALEFLRGRRNGVVVTVKRDGRPQLSNVIYKVGDDGLIRVSVTAGRAKTKNAQRDPRVSFYSTAEDFWSYVVVDGTAELTPPASSTDDATVEQLVDLYRSMVGEHPDWNEYRQAMVKDQRQVLIIHPEHAYGAIAR